MSYKIDRLPVMIEIGKESENDVERIVFDVSAWLKKWPDMIFAVMPIRPGETEAYSAVSHLDGDELSWIVKAYDTAIPGMGTVEIIGLGPSGERKLSHREVATSIAGTTLQTMKDAEEADRPWIDAVIQAADDAQKAADRAEAAVSGTALVSFEINSDGHLVMTKSNNIPELDFALVEGVLEVRYG